MLRSVATSLACLPLLSSFITASQSTLETAKAGRTLVASAMVVTRNTEAAASTILFVNIFFPAQVRIYRRRTVFQNARVINRGANPLWQRYFGSPEAERSTVSGFGLGETGERWLAFFLQCGYAFGEIGAEKSHHLECQRRVEGGTCDA